MKILFWTGGLWPRLGGIETFCATLLQEYTQRDCEIEIITPQDYAHYPKLENYLGFTIHRLPFTQTYREKNVAGVMECLQYIKRLIQQFKPDLIHLHVGFSEHLFVYRMLQNLELPALMTMHGFTLAEVPYLGAVLTPLLSSATHITTVSQALHNEIIAFAPAVATLTSVVRNGATSPAIPMIEAPTDRCEFLVAGRMHDEKGIDLAIKAMPNVLAAVPHVKLRLVGDGIAQASLKKLIATLNLQQHVVIEPKVPIHAVAELMQQANVILMPSRYEAFGLVALEAALVARPVIASNIGGLPEIVQHQVTGLLFERENIAELAQAMIQLASQPELAKQYGVAAKINAEKHFTAKKMADEYWQLYKKITTRSPQEIIHEQIAIA